MYLLTAREMKTNLYALPQQVNTAATDGATVTAATAATVTAATEKVTDTDTDTVTEATKSTVSIVLTVFRSVDYRLMFHQSLRDPVQRFSVIHSATTGS